MNGVSVEISHILKHTTSIPIEKLILKRDNFLQSITMNSVPCPVSCVLL